jgi:two-component system response regulator PilR (NtrC family)
MQKILVVDDDDTIRETLFELLSEAYACQTADTAEQAFAKLERDSFDVVVTDISMPGISGLELLEHVRQNSPALPSLSRPASAINERAQELIRLGAFDFLLKPFTLDAVENCVRRAIEYRGQRRED